MNTDFKKAIFLVEDIQDNKIITLLERVYEKLINKLDEEETPLIWISEITRTLNNHPSDYITFKKASEFIKENQHIPENINVFYFISCWLHSGTFHLTNFLSMDPNVLDFLASNNIPIIIDGSTEGDNIYRSTHLTFEDPCYINELKRYLKGIDKFKFYIVGGQLATDYYSHHPKRFIKEHRMFPGAFFLRSWHNSDLYNKCIEKREILFDKIKNKVITEDTPIWQAFCRQPRLTRILFQIYADHLNLTQHGSYSRLIPAKDAFLQESSATEIFKNHSHRLNFINDTYLKNLEKIKYINNYDYDHRNLGMPFTMDSMFHIVLETCHITSEFDFKCTPSMLTEKTSMAILSGVPFITLGGHKLKKILRLLGFREYIGLELPDDGYCNYFHELLYVLEKVQKIINLPLYKKQDLYESWKATIMYNYDVHLAIDPKKLYLSCLYNDI